MMRACASRLARTPYPRPSPARNAGKTFDAPVSNVFAAHPRKTPLQGASPRPPPWVTIGPRKEFQMAGESTPHAGGNKGGWHSGRFAHTFAAIDLGTNNCRLLVARASVDGYEVIDAYSRPVRLGEGVALSGSLCGEAIERTLDALGVCASKIERHKVSRARHIATEACRRACNGDDFLATVKQRTGLCFEVIPPSEEARLALASCENLLDPEIPYGLLIDIGGGSTEVSWIRVSHRADRLGGVATELLDMTSVPWGVVTLTEVLRQGPAARAAGHARLLRRHGRAHPRRSAPVLRQARASARRSPAARSRWSAPRAP